ncbi:hypothetical protein, partial [Mesorhizobium sp. M0276]|uniref:hypothetical protein n=1 Tax=Mesorhizobium sp. M0276 TaxID=2956928 RepID=UPI003338EBAC
MRIFEGPDEIHPWSLFEQRLLLAYPPPDGPPIISRIAYRLWLVGLTECKRARFSSRNGLSAMLAPPKEQRSDLMSPPDL